MTESEHITACNCKVRNEITTTSLPALARTAAPKGSLQTHSFFLQPILHKQDYSPVNTLQWLPTAALIVPAGRAKNWPLALL